LKNKKNKKILGSQMDKQFEGDKNRLKKDLLAQIES